MKKLVLPVLLVLSVGAAGARGDGPAARPAAPAEPAGAAAPTRDGDPVAVVDGTPITLGEYKDYLYRQTRDALLDTLINEMLIRKEAKRLDIKVTPQDENDWIEARIQEMADSGIPQYQVLDKDEVRRQYRVHAQLGAILERLVKARRTSEEGIRREYELRFGERRRARHILFQVKAGPDGKPDAASVEAAKKRADDVYAQLKKGADFGEMAKKLSEDPGSRNEGGELPEFGKGDMVPEFAEVAFKLKEGEVSEPVLSQFGWHIVQVTKILPPAKPFDDEVKAELKQEAARRPIDRDELDRFLKDLREGVKVEKLIGESAAKKNG
jgi:parvulin-like peptidyl-prolyl isomerase